MNEMRKLTMLFVILIWFSVLSFLVYVLVYASEDNEVKKYSFTIGIFFIALTQLLRRLFNHYYISNNGSRNSC